MSLRNASEQARKGRFREVLRAGLNKDVDVRLTGQGEIAPRTPRSMVTLVSNPQDVGVGLAGQGHIAPWTPQSIVPLVSNPHFGPGYRDPSVPDERYGRQQRLYGGVGVFDALPKIMTESRNDGVYYYERVFVDEERGFTDYVLRHIELAPPMGGRVQFIGKVGFESAVRWSGSDGWIDLFGTRGEEKISEMELTGDTMKIIGDLLPRDSAVTKVDELAENLLEVQHAIHWMEQKAIIAAYERVKERELQSSSEIEKWKQALQPDRRYRNLKLSIKRNVTTFEKTGADDGLLSIFPNSGKDELFITVVGKYTSPEEHKRSDVPSAEEWAARIVLFNNTLEVDRVQAITREEPAELKHEEEKEEKINQKEEWDKYVRSIVDFCFAISNGALSWVSEDKGALATFTRIFSGLAIGAVGAQVAHGQSLAALMRGAPSRLR